MIQILGPQLANCVTEASDLTFLFFGFPMCRIRVEISPPRVVETIKCACVSLVCDIFDYNNLAHREDCLVLTIIFE